MSLIEYLLFSRTYLVFCKHMKNVRYSQASILINYGTAMSKTYFSLWVYCTTSFDFQEV